MPRCSRSERGGGSSGLGWGGGRGGVGWVGGRVARASGRRACSADLASRCRRSSCDCSSSRFLRSRLTKTPNPFSARRRPPSAFLSLARATFVRPHRFSSSLGLRVERVFQLGMDETAAPASSAACSIPETLAGGRPKGRQAPALAAAANERPRGGLAGGMESRGFGSTEPVGPNQKRQTPGNTSNQWQH